MNLRDIYQTLFAGKKLRLQFDSSSEALTFRAKLYRFKKQQDQILLATELIEDRQRLVYLTEPLLLPQGAVQVVIYLEDKGPTKEYEVCIIEDDDDRREQEG